MTMAIVRNIKHVSHVEPAILPALGLHGAFDILIQSDDLQPPDLQAACPSDRTESFWGGSELGNQKQKHLQVRSCPATLLGLFLLFSLKITMLDWVRKVQTNRAIRWKLILYFVATECQNALLLKLHLYFFDYLCLVRPVSSYVSRAYKLIYNVPYTSLYYIPSCPFPTFVCFWSVQSNDRRLAWLSRKVPSIGCRLGDESEIKSDSQWFVRYRNRRS